MYTIQIPSCFYEHLITVLSLCFCITAIQKIFLYYPPESGVDDRVRTYSLTYSQSICFDMMGFGANFTMRESA